MFWEFTLDEKLSSMLSLNNKYFDNEKCKDEMDSVMVMNFNCNTKKFKHEQL